MVLDPFYLIVSHVDDLARVAATGVRLVQLRVKNVDESEVRRQVALAQQICRAHDIQLVVNDYWQIAIECGAEWVHLGQEDMDDADFDAMARAGLQWGLSTHDDAELERALSYSPSYLALGPVFETTLKVMPWAPQGLDRVTEWKGRVGDLPLVGIGGLTPDRAPAVLAAGANSVAVVSDVQQADDPVERCHQWLAVTRSYMP